jgi:hypothetical protein
MPSFYTVLLSELPNLAKGVEHFHEAQRNRVLDILIEELRLSVANNLPANPQTIAEVKNIVKAKAVVQQDTNTDVDVQTEASKKLSKLRAKIFEKTSAASIDDAEDDPVKAGLNELSTQDLSNIVFYQKGRSTPLSDMI